MPRLGLAVALAVALAPAARAATPDPLLPADADTVISVNVKQVLGSEIVKQYALGQLKDFLKGQDAQKFLTDLGLDPLKDIDRVVLGGSGTDQADMKFLAVVRGTFDPDKLYDAAVAQTKKDADHFSLVKDGDGKVFKYQPDNGNPVYATVVDKTAVVLGSEKKLVSAAAAGKGAGVSKELAALIGKMDDKNSVWVAAVVKGKLDNLKLPGGGAGGGNPAVQKQLAALESITAVVNVTGDINLEVALGMKDEEAADQMGQTVAQGLQQVKGLLPLLIGGQPQLKPLVKEAQSLNSRVKDKNVVVTAKLSGSAIGQMLGAEE
jgi:hypothetical protein